MRVLYCHQHFSTPQGAAGTRSYEMARALIRSGHRVTMVCGSYLQGKTGLHGPFVKGVRSGVVDDIDVIEFDLSYSNTISFFRRTRIFFSYALSCIKLSITENYDVIFATTTPLTAGLPGICSKWLRGKPFVFEVRDLWPELPRAMGAITNPLVLGLMSILEWISYRSADRLVGLSPGIVDGISFRGVSRRDIKMIPNGCDLDLFQGYEEPWRPSGVKADDFLAVFTGTHGNANGLHAVLDVAKELQNRGDTSVKFVLVGEGGEKAELVARAEREQLTSVLFLDSVPKQDLAGLMGGADIGLQLLRNVPAFYYGTSPNKFFDYISAGLPVLNNYPGWISDLICECDCGYAVEADDPIAFANALMAAKENPAGLKLKAENARELAAAKFDRRQLSRDWVDWVIGAAEACE